VSEREGARERGRERRREREERGLAGGREEGREEGSARALKGSNEKITQGWRSMCSSSRHSDLDQLDDYSFCFLHIFPFLIKYEQDSLPKYSHLLCLHSRPAQRHSKLD
jgi:hypothetical protein